MVGVGAGDTLVAVGKQSALGTYATNIYTMKGDEFSEDTGRIKDQGRPEVGGGLATGLTLDVYGARPTVSGRAKLRIGSMLHLLQGAGYAYAGTAANGAGTSLYFVQQTAGTLVPYLSFDFDYGGVKHAGVKDVRTNLLDIEVIPGQAPLVTYSGQGLNHLDSAVTQQAEIADYTPTPAATIVAAHRTLFGSTGGTLYSFGFNVQSQLVIQQPIGSIYGDDVVLTQYVTAMRATVQMSAADYNRVSYGGTAATSVGATLATGAFLLRVNTADTIQGTATGWIEWNFASVKYDRAGPIRSVAGNNVLIPLLIQPTAIGTVGAFNTTSGTAYV